MDIQNVESSKVGRIHDDFILGNIGEDECESMLKEENMDEKKVKDVVEKWKSHVVKSSKISSSVDKAVGKAEDYFGTLAEDATVACQDVITEKDKLEMDKIAEENGVLAKVGKYSVTFVDKDEYLDNVINVIGKEKLESSKKVVLKSSRQDWEIQNEAKRLGYYFEYNPQYDCADIFRRSDNEWIGSCGGGGFGYADGVVQDGSDKIPDEIFNKVISLAEEYYHLFFDMSVDEMMDDDLE